MHVFIIIIIVLQPWWREIFSLSADWLLVYINLDISFSTLILLLHQVHIRHPEQPLSIFISILAAATIHPVAQDNLNHISIIRTSNWSSSLVLVVPKYTVFFHTLLHYPLLCLTISCGMFLKPAEWPPCLQASPTIALLPRDFLIDLSAIFTQNSSTAPCSWHRTLCPSCCGSVKIASLLNVKCSTYTRN